MSGASRTARAGDRVEPQGADVLAAIVAATRTAVADRRAAGSEADLRERARRRKPRGARFRNALDGAGINLIAECKRRSPSKGVLRARYDAAAIASGYVRAGAVAISVLTEPAFFDGALADLETVRQRVDVPLLRKDFIIDRWQIVEARAAGADAVLLIVAALRDDDLRDLLACAVDEELATLVEVHDREELAQALEAGARVVGVNSRNLRSLTVDRDLHESLIEGIPDACLAVAESGLGRASDVGRLRAAGYDAFLIGERFMAASDPEAAVRELLDAVAERNGGRVG